MSKKQWRKFKLSKRFAFLPHKINGGYLWLSFYMVKEVELDSKWIVRKQAMMRNGLILEETWEDC